MTQGKYKTNKGKEGIKVADPFRAPDTLIQHIDHDTGLKEAPKGSLGQRIRKAGLWIWFKIFGRLGI